MNQTAIHNKSVRTQYPVAVSEQLDEATQSASDEKIDL